MNDGPEDAFAARRKLHEALDAVVRAYADVTGEQPFLVASLAAAWLIERSHLIHEEHAGAGCATTASR